MRISKLFRSLASFLLKAEHENSVMVALFVPMKTAKALELPNGEKAKDMHITLAYIGKNIDQKVIEECKKALSSLAKSVKSIKGEIHGIGRFNATEHSDGKDVIYAVPDILGLQEFRAAMVRKFDEMNIPCHKDFDFTPHITLAYISENSEFTETVETIPLDFEAITLAVGEKRFDFKLGQ